MKTELSPRQREIMRLVCDGLTEKEIVAELGFSRSAFRSHKTRIFLRLNARTFAQAVCRFVSAAERKAERLT